MGSSNTDYKKAICLQEEARGVVLREIQGNASQLIRHFEEAPDALENSGYSYEHDLIPILQKPDFKSVTTHSDSMEVEYSTALEHWIVSPWLGSQLFDMGEMVGEIFGMHFWGRQTSGQAIYMDSVIQAIANPHRRDNLVRTVENEQLDSLSTIV